MGLDEVKSSNDSRSTLSQHREQTETDLKSCIDQLRNSEEIVDKQRQNIKQCEREICGTDTLMGKTNDQTERDKLKAEKQAVRETEQHVQESMAN